MNPSTTYKKHHSFAYFDKNSEKEIRALQRISSIRTKTDWIHELPQAHQFILKKVFDDLFDDKEPKKEPRFTLSPYTVEEIDSYRNDSVLPRYLVHRYRYEMYPQLHIIDEYPPCLQIEPASICNFRCIFCYQSDPSFSQKKYGYQGQMSLDLYKRVVDMAEGNVEFLSLASRGEPLISKDIKTMLEYARGKFLNLKLNTNASRLSEEICHSILQNGVKTLVFSVDAAEEELFRKLRVGGDLSVVFQNVLRFKEIRETQYPHAEIITRISGVKISEKQEISSMKAMWGDIVDQVSFVTYNPAHSLIQETQEALISGDSIYEQTTNDLDTPCSELWRRIFVWWDGVTNPCESDYKSKLSVGNIQENTLHGLWTSEEYAVLRKIHLHAKRHQQFPCNRCVVT
jgi:radical SAM protein with 4Fe4S-binding SPASM domain